MRSSRSAARPRAPRRRARCHSNSPLACCTVASLAAAAKRQSGKAAKRQSGKATAGNPPPVSAPPLSVVRCSSSSCGTSRGSRRSRTS
eukprot:6560879-Prymnesium_polylepis.1